MQHAACLFARNLYLDDGQSQDAILRRRQIRQGGVALTRGRNSGSPVVRGLPEIRSDYQR